MRKFLILTAAILLGTSVGLANTSTTESTFTYGYKYGKSFIFTENGITFSVYPDGEFDFYMNRLFNVGARADFGDLGITFNSGYDYNAYVQYDDYGAVLQVENVPIYYDYYGRVEQIGDVRINYRNGRVHRVGGLYAYYTPAGYFDYYTGYINVYNRYYVYRPWHGYFARPGIGFCLVYNNPYRRYYNPIRYSWYRPYRYNHRRAYASIGRSYNYNNGWNRRGKIYRNDDRVVARQYRHRKGDSYRSSTNTRGQVDERGRRNTRSEGVVSRSNIKRGATSTRSNTRSSVNRKKDIDRSGIKRSQVVKRSSDGNRNVVKKRSVSSSPKRTVTKRTTSVKRPDTRSIKRDVGSRSTAQRSTVKRSPVNKSTSSKRSTVSRSTTTKRSYKAPSRSSSKSRSSVASRSPQRSTTKARSSSQRSSPKARSSSQRSTPKARSSSSSSRTRSTSKRH